MNRHITKTETISICQNFEMLICLLKYKRSTVKNLNILFDSFLPQIVSAVIALITIRMYSEFLTPNQLGEAMLALGIMALFDAIFSSSVNQVVFYYGSKDNLKIQVYNVLNEYKNYAMSMGAILIVIIFLLTVCFQWVLFQFWIVFILMLFSYAIIEPSRSSLFSLLNVVSNKRTYGIQVIFDAFFTLLMTSFAIWYEPNWEYLLLGILMARFLSLFSNSFFLKRTFNNLEIGIHEQKTSFTKKEIFYQMKPIMLMGILGWLSGFADRYIVAGTIGVTGTGYYSVASGVVGKPYNVTTAALTAYNRPDFYVSFSKNEANEIDKIQERWLIGAFVIGFIGVLLFYFMGGTSVNLLLSKNYRGHIEGLLWIMAASMTATIMTHVFDNKLLAQGLGNKLFLLQLILIPISLLAIALGAVFYGVIGAAYGKLISELIKFIFTFYYSNKINI
jgi:O-antigen/teichoic acid export membrane protein